MSPWIGSECMGEDAELILPCMEPLSLGHLVLLT